MNRPQPKPWEAGFYGDPRVANVSEPLPEYNRNPMPSVGYICNQCVAIVQHDQQAAHTKWHDNQRRMTVSTVLWCDAADHPFKAGRPGSQSVQGTEVNEEGQSVSVQQDVCPECAQAARQQRAVRALAAESLKPEQCPVCEAVALVHNKATGANMCLECGWSSHDDAKRIINQTYGKAARHARYMSDDSPEAG